MNPAQSTPTQMFPLDGGATPVTGELLASENGYLRAFEHGRGMVASIAALQPVVEEIARPEARNLDLLEMDDTLDHTPAYAPHLG
jgi:hypothetical protein